MAVLYHSDSSGRVGEVEDRLKGELDQLVIDIWRIGDPEKPEVLFGELFDDDEVQNYYEALVGTLKAAKKRVADAGSDRRARGVRHRALPGRSERDLLGHWRLHLRCCVRWAIRSQPSDWM